MVEKFRTPLVKKYHIYREFQNLLGKDMISENKNLLGMLWILCVLIIVLNGCCLYYIYCDFLYEFFELANYTGVGVDINMRDMDIHRIIGEESGGTGEEKEEEKKEYKSTCAPDDEECLEQERNLWRFMKTLGAWVLLSGTLKMLEANVEGMTRLVWDIIELCSKK